MTDETEAETIEAPPPATETAQPTTVEPFLAMPEKPEWLSQNDYDAKRKGIPVDRLAKRLADQHAELTRLQQAAAAPEKYELPADAGVDPDCPLAKSVFEAAKASKMSQAQFEAIVRTWPATRAAAVESERQKLLAEMGGDETALTKRMDLLSGRVKALANGDAEQLAAAAELARTAAGAKFLEKAVKDATVHIPGDAGAAPMNKDEILKLQASPEYTRGEPKAVETVREFYKRMAQAT